MRIWARTIKGEKIIKDIIDNYTPFNNIRGYETTLTEICHRMDIPTPITLKYHYNCFHEFNMVKYLPSEFVEKVDFDTLIIENCIDK